MKAARVRLEKETTGAGVSCLCKIKPEWLKEGNAASLGRDDSAQSVTSRTFPGAAESGEEQKEEEISGYSL